MKTKSRRRPDFRTTQRISNDERETLKYERAIRPRRVTQVKLSRLPRSMSVSHAKTHYADYLRSSHWRAFRELYFKSANTSKTCVVCHSSEIELHHRTYERLGNEFFTDVIPLCRGHHEQTHERERAGAPLWTAHLSS